jgi:hypothetical protein
MYLYIYMYINRPKFASVLGVHMSAHAYPLYGHIRRGPLCTYICIHTYTHTHTHTHTHMYVYEYMSTHT